jgi:hypothetical protein
MWTHDTPGGGGGVLLQLLQLAAGTAELTLLQQLGTLAGVAISKHRGSLKPVQSLCR